MYALTDEVLHVFGQARACVNLINIIVFLDLCLLGTAVLYGTLGLGEVDSQTLLLLVGPLGCLLLAVRRPVREWTRPGRGTRAREQRRGTQRSG